MLKRIQAGFKKFTEGMVATMLAVMFFAFLLQIFSRYVLSAPLGWTLELCLTLWVWVVFWGCAFNVRQKDHVTFDVVYYSVRPPIRKLFALFSAASIVGIMAYSFIPTWGYIDFLKIKNSATLSIPMRDVFSIYMVFIASTVIIYTYRFFNILIFGLPKSETDLKEKIKSGGEM